VKHPLYPFCVWFRPWPQGPGRAAPEGRRARRARR
jgi:hypothetical protein